MDEATTHLTKAEALDLAASIWDSVVVLEAHGEDRVAAEMRDWAAWLLTRALEPEGGNS